jgi:mono/diheme cytochrome c family protein
MSKTRALVLLGSIFLLLLVALPACYAPVTVTATVTQGIITQPAPTGTYTSNGQRIFLTGTSASGNAIYSQGYMMMGRYVVCADCHGTQGKGGAVSMMMYNFGAPNITWTSLTDSKVNNPPYTVDTLKKAITQGIGSDGTALNTFMPRWNMSAQDLSDLVSYLQTLK